MKVSSQAVKVTSFTLLTLFSVLLGFQTEPRTCAGKILLSSSWLLVIVISSVYSANLMAVLTAGTGLLKISSISDLVDSDYTVGMYDVGIAFDVMKVIV